MQRRARRNTFQTQESHKYIFAQQYWFMENQNCNYIIKKMMGPGAVTHACNTSTLKAEVGGSCEVRSLRLVWPT